jgi:hypothetical protein
VARPLRAGERFFRQSAARPRRSQDEGGGDVVTVPVPDELDWYIWRPVVHERRLCTLRELQEFYSLDDLREMHAALDVIDELAAKVAAEAKRRSEQKH